jgi:hypothetical protein
VSVVSLTIGLIVTVWGWKFGMRVERPRSLRGMSCTPEPELFSVIAISLRIDPGELLGLKSPMRRVFDGYEIPDRG